MRKSLDTTIVVISLLAGAGQVYAQGLIEWGDIQPGYSISIMSPNPANQTDEQTGNTSWDYPAGATDYGGGWIGGDASAPGGGVGATPANGPGGYDYQLNGNFEVGLYVATSQAALTDAILGGTPLATTNINGGGEAGLYGNVSGRQMVVADPSLAAGTQVYVGIAAWYSASGDGSYAAAEEDMVPSGYVESTSSVALGGPGSPANLIGIGLASFSLVADNFIEGAPYVITLPATGVTGSSATLNALAYPGSNAAAVYFVYGTNTGYGAMTVGTNVGNGPSAITVSLNATELLPGTLYHYQAVVSNSLGTASGWDSTFTTADEPPQAAIQPVTAITTGSATLNATVNPEGAATTMYFVYGPSTNFGSTNYVQNIGPGTDPLSVSITVANLEQGALYYVHAFASNSVGTGSGGQLTFTTAPLGPLATTEAATSVTANSAVLNVLVNPEGELTTYYFQFGASTNYGDSTGEYNAGNGTNAFSGGIFVTGLLPGTLYHFQAYASNALDSDSGGDMTFITPAVIGTPPVLTGAEFLGHGIVRFSFTNKPDATFTVLSSTNLMLPLSSWTVAGAPTSMGSGVFQFTSQPTTNDATRFYAIRSP